MKKIIKQISLSWIIYFIISHYFMMPVHAAATVYNDDVVGKLTDVLTKFKETQTF